MSHTEEVECPTVAISHVIGPGGSTIKKLKEETETSINIEGNTVKISGDDEGNVKKAAAKVRAIIEEQANPDYEGPEGKRLRAEAQGYGDARTAKSAEADEAFKSGDKETGHKLMKEAKELGEKMHATHKLAAKAIIKNRNDGHGEDYLDLHGLRTDEALEITNERLDALEAKPEGTVTELELIPGAGHHSAPGKQALKPACEDLLKQRGIEYADATAGSFTVKVLGKGKGGAAPAAAPAAEEKAEEKAEEPKKEEAKEEGKKEEAKAEHKAEEKKDEKKDEPKKEEEAKTENKSCCTVM